MRILTWSVGLICILGLMIGCGGAVGTSGDCTTSSCPSGQTCQNGTCVNSSAPACARGWTDCSGTCTKMLDDVAHCGACGNACGKAYSLTKGIVVGDYSTNLIAPNDTVNSVAIDKSGNIYVTGSFSEKATFGSKTLKTSNSAIFVAKMSPSGDWLWVTSGGSHGSPDGGSRLAIDSAGNTYVTGSFVDKASFGNITINGESSRNVFVAKIDTSGKWVWVSHAASKSSDERGTGITVDKSGNIYVTGVFGDTVSFGDVELTSAGKEDVFVAKLDKDGKWVWARGAGGAEDDESSAIAVSDTGTLYVTGHFSTEAKFNDTTLTATKGIFVVTFDLDGKWGWAVGGGGPNVFGTARDIVVDASGDAYVVGSCGGKDVSFGDTKLTFVGSGDAFVAKIGKDGKWKWASRAGGFYAEKGGYGIALDEAGAIYITGVSSKDATFGEKKVAEAGLFVAKLDKEGTFLWVATGRGGSATGHDIKAANGKLYVVGSFKESIKSADGSLRGRAGFDGFVANVGEGAPVCSEGVCL